MSNPVLSRDVFREGYSQTGAMTVAGAIQKTFLLAIICLIAAFFAWDNPHAPTLQIVGLAGGLIVGLAICFKPNWAPFLSPVYALLEGLFLGAVSSFFEAKMQGIVIQTVAVTGAVFFAMLACYQLNLIRPTQKFRSLVVGATAGIVLFYLAGFVMRLVTGSNFSIITGNSGMAIGFSCVVCLIAAFNLIIDFGAIEDGAEANAPKYMEWYAAFGLLVTIVWLYLEILRLLSKLRSR